MTIFIPSPEVADALATGKPVVALESTIITHGMPYPQNLEVARTVESDIRGYGVGPEVIWQPLNSLRLIGGYEYRKRKNQLLVDSNERSKVEEWYGNLTWNKSGKGTLSADIRLLQIDFTGEENTFVAYQLLEALNPGQNTTWRLNWLQTLGSGVQMTLQYNGRTSEGSAPIHTGTIVMTAYF